MDEEKGGLDQAVVDEVDFGSVKAEDDEDMPLGVKKFLQMRKVMVSLFFAIRYTKRGLLSSLRYWFERASLVEGGGGLKHVFFLPESTNALHALVRTRPGVLRVRIR